MKKILSTGVILLFILSAFAPLSLGQNVKKSDKHLIINSARGNILYVGGNGPGNYSKIQDAIDDASNGDIIFVYSGRYLEEIKIGLSINLIGENKEITEIEGGYCDCVVDIFSDGVNISGFTIDAFYDCDVGINIRSNNSIISDVTIYSGWDGIHIDGSFNTIKNSLFYQNVCGLVSSNTNNNSIIDCHFEVLFYGICLNKVNNFKIINCSNDYFADNLIHLINSSQNKIINLSSHNYFWICIRLTNSSNNEIIDSLFFGGVSAIILESNSNENIIKNNIFNKVVYGITNNWTDPGLNFNKICENNIFYNNCFLECYEVSAYDKYSNSWDNGSFGNYWDDYTGLDENSDGIGDTPYPIPGGDNKDRYPLMRPTIPDNDKPKIKITKPYNGLFINDKKIGPFKFSKPLIIGEINITAEVSDETTSIERVEFYINNETQPSYIDYTCYHGEANWVWAPKILQRMKEPFKSQYKIKAVAYDLFGNYETQEITVKRISPAAVIGGSIAVTLTTLIILKILRDSF